MKMDSVVSLKWPVFLDGVGRFLVFEAETLGTASGRFQALVKRVWRRGRWVAVRPAKLWVGEDCVASRRYVAPAAMQKELRFD